MSSLSELRPEVRERLERALAGRSSPTREEHRRRGVVAMVVALAPIVAELLLRGVHAGGRPPGYLVVVATGWAALVVAASIWVLRPAPSSLGLPRPKMLVVAAALPCSLLAVSFLAGLAFPNTLHTPGYGWRLHLVCALMAIGLSVVPVGVALWRFRRSDPVRPAVTGAALGAVAASWSGAAIAIQCPHAELLHVALGHVAPIVLAAALTAVIGARVLSLRWIR